MTSPSLWVRRRPTGPRPSPVWLSARGFSLIELSLVLVILGLLSVVAVPKLVRSAPLTLHAQAELLATDLRRVQWLATSGNRSLCVANTVAQYSVHPQTGSCQLQVPVNDPNTLSAWQVSLPNALTLTDTVSAQPLSFNSWGQPSRAGAWRLAVASSTASVVVQMAPLTGFITSVSTP